MTRISEIHGIGRDEYAQRGQNVVETGYVPYLSLTQGEMRLMLALKQAKVLAQFYPEVPQYRQAASLIENALSAGVSRGVNFVGALHDNYLQQVASVIQAASEQTAPASKNGLFARSGGIVRGIGEIIPVQQRRDACMKKVIEKGGGAGAIKKGAEACDRQFNIEKIFNNAIENTGHHVLYHRIPEGGIVPQDVKTKRLFHVGGVEGMAVAGDISRSLMQDWVETGILSKNAQIGVGPLGSVKASVQLAPSPDEALAKIIDPSSDKYRPGVQGIGVAPAAAIIITAIASALVAAKNLIESLRKQQATIAAQSFGTSAYSGSTYDWQTGSQNPETTLGLSTTNLLLIAAGAGLLLWANSDNKSA